MKPRIQILIGLIVLLAASQASAASYTEGTVEELTSAKRRLAQVEQTTKGAPRLEAVQEQRRIDRLISDLEAGRSVDPKEIDHALERAGESRR